MDILMEGKRVFDIEIETLRKIRDGLNGEFTKLIDMILQSKGRVIITGMGKSGHIGRKIAATMASLGTPSYFLHPAEGAHGDLGMITGDDVIIAISNSGETEEVIQLVPSIRRIGARLVSITGKENSTLGKYAELSIVLPVSKEACAHNLAPTTSTTAVLVFGDALSVALSRMIGFKPEDFAVFHPNGSLGKKLLLRVRDIMHSGEENPIVKESQFLKDVIYVISQKGLGAVSIVDDDGIIVGIITDGDLRRILEKSIDNHEIFDLNVGEIMSKNPLTINDESLAVDALNIMENRPRQISVLPVVDKDSRPVGMIRIHDIVKAGVEL